MRIEESQKTVDFEFSVDSCDDGDVPRVRGDDYCPLGLRTHVAEVAGAVDKAYAVLSIAKRPAPQTSNEISS
jgi:hypothetical protein